MKLIYIEWQDCAYKQGWSTKEKAIEWAKDGGWHIRQIGFLLDETEDYVLLCDSWSPEDDWKNKEYTGLVKVPKGWIKNRKDLTKYIE